MSDYPQHRPETSVRTSVPENCIVLIPAYEPDRRLVAIIKALLPSGFAAIVVVDDGSHKNSAPVLREIEGLGPVAVLRHAENRGKGAALATGFAHILESCPTVRGVVTADADGQHLPEDICRVGRQLCRTPDCLVLGVRRFGQDVPLRSRIGNRVTRSLFRLLLGLGVEDTQTGLRGIPAGLLPQLLRLKSGRYAYELEMLLSLHHDGVPIVQVPVTTVYENGNRSSHFRPLADSIRIYRVLARHVITKRLLRFFKYSLSSLLSTLVDYGVYALLLIPERDYVTASAVARIFSVAAHFLANKYFTFGHRNLPTRGEALRYLLVALANLSGSILLIFLLVTHAGVGEFVAKVLAQSALFLITYLLLRGIVFVKTEKS